MISYDVQSLYPSISVKEAIKLAVNLIWKKNEQLKTTKITKNELFILFNLAVRNVHSRFFNEFYRQIDGVAMGSPLAPILVNLFMNHLEKEKILPIINIKVKIWKRYIDDIFTIVKGNRDNALEILNDINQIHKNIQFTMELEEENSIPFLDVRVKRTNQLIETSVYRKKMNTNLYMKWDNCLPKYQKLGLISSLVARAYHLCLSDVIVNNEIVFIKKILNHNGYPKKN